MESSQQEEAILRAIAVSFAPAGSGASSFSPSDRNAAFSLIEEFKQFAGRIQMVLGWLTRPGRILYQNQDITVVTQLLATQVLTQFLQKDYSGLNEADRLSLRHAVLQSCRVVAAASCSTSMEAGTMQNQQERRILAKKLAALLEGLVIRDFPQRWTSFATDVFDPMILTTADGNAGGGGLWYTDTNQDGSGVHLGVNMCLEMLKLVAEDCTDSDFNAKINTTRRNDVMIGLNEIRDAFLPKIYQLLSTVSSGVQQANATLRTMQLYLQSNGRTTASLSVQEHSMYQMQIAQRQNLSLLLHDVFVMLEKFASSFPLVWIVGPVSSTVSFSSFRNLPATSPTEERDFVTAILFLFRERESSVQVRAVECVEMLAVRGKLEFSQWIRLIREVPIVIQQANQQFLEWYQQRQVEQQVTTTNALPSSLSSVMNNGGGDEHPLALQLDFHRALSRMMATLLTSHLSHLNSSKQVSTRGSPSFVSIQSFLRLLVEILHHPSGRMGTEQVAMWTSLCRDPQIAKTGLLEPFLEQVLVCYMDQLVKVRWEDVENQTHPNYQVFEASYDDEDDYDDWMGELRSKTSLFFKYVGNVAPVIASRALQSRTSHLLAAHGLGQPLDWLDSTNQQLTPKSDSVLKFEALYHPLDNTLSGIPSWVFSTDESKFASPDRLKIATATRSSLSELARELVAWNPAYLWLKFRRASLLDPLKYVWQYDTTTLLQGIDSLLRYLGLPDEWRVPSVFPGTASDDSLSGEIVSLKKKSGVTLVSVSKKVPQHLVPWLAQLSEATRSLLSSDGLIPLNQMHLYEFLTCVVSAVDDPQARSQFISNVLSDAMETIESKEVHQMVQSSHALLHTFGVANAQSSTVTDPANVKAISVQYTRLFAAYNRLLSVGRRCNEASKRRALDKANATNAMATPVAPQLNFVDEGPVSIQELAVNDPFVPLWPRILPHLLTLYESILSVWRPEHQAVLLANPLQRYVYAISDDDVYLAKNQDNKSGGVFGEGGTAGSVVAGTDRRHMNLVPKWSGWFSELRNGCFQLLALLSAQRVMFAPELVSLYPRLVAVITDPLNLRSMEHRQFIQFLTHVVELLLVSCPSTLYATHLSPILSPVVEHVRYRLEKTWIHVVQNASSASALHVSHTKALKSADSANAAALAAQGGDAWFSWYYAHAGLFVGDVDDVTAESVVDKHRVEIGRTFSDVLQVALALKGEWALVLANQAKEELSIKRNDPNVLMEGPAASIYEEGVVLNADGTTKTVGQSLSDARSLLRINGLRHFLLLENEQIAFNLTLSVIQCLGYPDAYTCRRITKICHRILETVAWSPPYSQVLGQQMFTQAVKNIVTEPKWMIGIEWDMINVVRDIFCRLVLGQILQSGGQGAAFQQVAIGPDSYEQAKSVDRPLQGGGVLTKASSYPRQVLAMLPGVDSNVIQTFERAMKEKLSAKSQKDCIRDLLREAADRLKEEQPGAGIGVGAAGSLFDRAVEEESLLHSNRRSSHVPDLPEKLVTSSQVAKAMRKMEQQENQSFDGLSAFEN